MKVRQRESRADTGDCDCTMLRKASRRISQIYDVALAPSGLKTTQRAILAQIRRSGPASVSTLADALVMDPGGLAHTLKPLDRDGFVKIGADPDDRRSRVVSLTAAGLAKLKEADVLWKIAQKSFKNALGQAEAVLLRESIKKLVSDEFAETLKRGL
jgi:DNA-binding MarR family transcriptional regulator